MTDGQSPRFSRTSAIGDWSSRPEKRTTPQPIMSLTGFPTRSRRGRVRGHGSGARIAAEALRMDFALSESQQAWHDAAARFAQDELTDDVLGRDERGEFW